MCPLLEARIYCAFYTWPEQVFLVQCLVDYQPSVCDWLIIEPCSYLTELEVS